MTRRRRASRWRRLPRGQDMLKRRETGSFKPDSHTCPDSFIAHSDIAAETLTLDTSSFLPDSDIGIEFHFAVFPFSWCLRMNIRILDDYHTCTPSRGVVDSISKHEPTRIPSKSTQILAPSHLTRIPAPSYTTRIPARLGYEVPHTRYSLHCTDCVMVVCVKVQILADETRSKD